MYQRKCTLAEPFETARNEVFQEIPIFRAVMNYRKPQLRRLDMYGMCDWPRLFVKRPL